MKVAVAVTDGMVADPGECDEIYFYEVGDHSFRFLEKLVNPGKNAPAARGVVMLKGALSKKTDAIILSEIGRPGFNFLKGKTKIYLADRMSSEEAIKLLSENSLKETTEPTHEGGHMEHHVH